MLKRLRAAITKILQSSSKHHQPVLDYEALTLLSNASRIQATKACDQLSQRLGSSRSQSSAASSSTSSKDRRRRSSHPASSSKGSRSSSSRGVSSRPVKERREESSRENRRKGERTDSNSQSPTATAKSRGATRSEARAGSLKRISLVSTSTYSTRLGEIPERKWLSRYSYDSNGSEYNVTPIYPLRPYEAPAKKKGFFGLFRRS